MIIVIAASRLSREVSIMNEQPNTTDQSQDQEESAYSLLIRSEETISAETGFTRSVDVDIQGSKDDKSAVAGFK
ncbi:MAG: hypothetical protein DME40_04820 [Verrucomicrobia bacterium]|nr:MAG: hypothetical protein DME40_04820 [Verrucomicrobiota bacterium]